MRCRANAVRIPTRGTFAGAYACDERGVTRLRARLMVSASAVIGVPRWPGTRRWGEWVGRGPGNLGVSQIECGRLLDGQISGFWHLSGSCPRSWQRAAIRHVWPVGHQAHAASTYALQSYILDGRLVAARSATRPRRLSISAGVCQHDERVCTRTGDRGEGAVQLVSTAQLHDVQVQAQRPSSRSPGWPARSHTPQRRGSPTRQCVRSGVASP